MMNNANRNGIDVQTRVVERHLYNENNMVLQCKSLSNTIIKRIEDKISIVCQC